MTGGAIIRASVKSDGVAAMLLDVLKSYFKGTSAIEMEFRPEESETPRTRTENVHSDQVDRTFALARELFGDSK